MPADALRRIDDAIAALQGVAPEKAPLAERIIARLIAARRGLCDDPSTCGVCSVPCNRHERWAALAEATGRIGAPQISSASTR
jgi:hypothetical protein